MNHRGTFIHSGTLTCGNWAQTPPDWTLLAAGDWAPMGPHIEALASDPASIYGDLLPILRASDLSIVNLECALGASDPAIIKDGPPLSTPAEAVRGLIAVPFGLCSLANNHSMDYGLPGLSKTLELLQAHELPAMGTGNSIAEAIQPFQVEMKGTRVATLNFAEGEEGAATEARAGVMPLDLPTLVTQVAKLRAKADVLIAVGHAGREYIPVPPPYVQRAYRALIDAGADLVIAHHPHVPQGIEIYRERLIAYSLGNFVFWDPDGHPWQQIGYLLRVNFAGRRLHSAEVIPYRIQPNRLTSLVGDERATFLDRLEKHSHYLSDSDAVAAIWEAYAERWRQQILSDELTLIVSLLLPQDRLFRVLRLGLSDRREILARALRRVLAWMEKLGATTTPPTHDRYRRGAAILHNRFFTPAHRELYLTALQRSIQPSSEIAPWARDFLDEWESMAK